MPKICGTNSQELAGKQVGAGEKIKYNLVNVIYGIPNSFRSAVEYRPLFPEIARERTFQSLYVVRHGDERGEHACRVGRGLGLGEEGREDEGQHDEGEAAELHHGEGHEDVGVGDDDGDGEERHDDDDDGDGDAVDGEPRQPTCIGSEDLHALSDTHIKG